MSAPAPLKIAVVGHTNTGKTSLLRTLTRDSGFGEVSDRPATTRHVEGATLTVRGQSVAELYDTPGLEDSIALLELLDASGAARRADGLEQIRAFLVGPEAHDRFAQEAKALRQVIETDISLYVIDARDRVLAKHRDELEILARCARPIVPVLNFVASPDAQITLWREHLSRAGLHAVAEFDTVVLDDQSERRLLEKMKTLLDRHHDVIDALIHERAEQRRQLISASAGMIADLLIDAAAHVVAAPMNDKPAMLHASEQLKQRLRSREQRCVEQLLALHRFRPEDLRPGELPISGGQWGVDLFNPAAMKQFGIKTGGGAAAGAMAGLTIDVLSHGLTLGVGTAIGAVLGAVLGAGQDKGRQIVDRARGLTELRCDDATLRLLWAREVSLLDALLRRGHASLAPIELSASPTASASTPLAQPKKLPEALNGARIRPQWSRLDERASPMAIAGAARRAAQDAVSEEIVRQLVRPGAQPSRRADQ